MPSEAGSFNKMLGICEPAQVAMMIYILMFAMHLSTNITTMKLDGRTLRFLVGVTLMSLTSVITLDVYCQTGHTTFAWTLAILSALGYMLLLTGHKTSEKEGFQENVRERWSGINA